MNADVIGDLLRHGDLQIEGRLRGASNTTLQCTVASGDDLLTCVYKPVTGERPLWDFPEWTLTRREVAAYELAQVAGWGQVPTTVWRDDGPAGAGMCQAWVHEDPQAEQVTVVRPDEVPPGWRHVLDAEDGLGNPLALVHADTVALARLALFDVIANNADRKGGHVLTDADGQVWAIDHGVTFAVEPKLRTVLWGWAGEPIPDPLVDEVAALVAALGTGYDPVDRWLDAEERDVLRARARRLVRDRMFPLPSGRWPAVPWPVF